MKTIILTSILVVLFSFTNINAGEPKQKVLTNVETTEWGTIKEMTYFDEEQSQADKKIVFHYDKADNMLQKTVYKWDGHEGWVGYQKYDYSYNEDGRVSVVTFRDWDKKKNDWSAKAKEMVHVYNEDGDLMAINK